MNYRIDTGGITDSGREESPKPTRRQDFSSTIPTLEHALPGVTDPTLRQDIIDYMDSRIGVRLVREVLDGDMTYARQVRTFYRGTPRGKARLAAAIARLPGPLARLIVRGGLLAKRRVRLGG